MELSVPSIEDAVIQLSEVKSPVSRIVVDALSTTFLAYNSLGGYSAINFHDSTGKMRALAAALGESLDLEASGRFYAGLYVDMVRLMAPNVEIVFRRDGVRVRPGESEGGVAADPLRSVGSAPGARDTQARPTAEAEGRRVHTLVAFGDSVTYGEELDTVELGRQDAAYRISRAYPHLLAHELGIPESDNRGRPATSNPKIMRDLCDFVSASRHDLDRYLFVVALAHPSRKAFVDRTGSEICFVNRQSTSAPPWVIDICAEAFLAPRNDELACLGVNAEVEHKCRIVRAFLRAVGARFVIFPTWDFADSGEYFLGKDLGNEVVLYFGKAFDEFGMSRVWWRLPRGPRFHPLSEGHSAFARELAVAIRKRALS